MLGVEPDVRLKLRILRSSPKLRSGVRHLED